MPEDYAIEAQCEGQLMRQKANALPSFFDNHPALAKPSKMNPSLTKRSLSDREAHYQERLELQIEIFTRDDRIESLEDLHEKISNETISCGFKLVQMKNQDGNEIFSNRFEKIEASEEMFSKD